MALAGALGWAAVPDIVRSETTVTSERSVSGGDGVSFEVVPGAAVNDAAAEAVFSIVAGVPDKNGAGLTALNDGQLPFGDDQPDGNFFFDAGTDGGRILIDLGHSAPVLRVGTFSWHRGERGPQVYTLYGALGDEEGLNREPKRNDDPEGSRWTKLAEVDTRRGETDNGGRYGVRIAAAEGILGEFRYLLFDVRRTEDRDPFGNTFFSEIDVVSAGATELELTAPPETVSAAFQTEDGKYRFTLDATAAPDLMEWSEEKLMPVVLEWYPKIVEMLPSEGFEARTDVRLRFRNDMGGIPASAGGGSVNMNAGWFRRELEREAIGAVVHELVHVVQEYGRGSEGRREGRPPGWLTEGIPDYIRWFLYEPETGGAKISRRNLAAARHDASYRVTANFLDWAMRNYDGELVKKLNVAARESRYEEGIWATLTGKPVEELEAEWKRALEEMLDGESRNENDIP